MFVWPSPVSCLPPLAQLMGCLSFHLLRPVTWGLMGPCVQPTGGPPHRPSSCLSPHISTPLEATHLTAARMKLSALPTARLSSPAASVRGAHSPARKAAPSPPSPALELAPSLPLRQLHFILWC